VKKYWLVFVTTIKEYFTYRLSFVLWRFRNLLNLLIIFFLWNAVLEKQPVFGSYNKETFLSYIIFVNLIVSFVMGTRTAEIASDIQNSSIINLLLKPVSFFKYNFTRDLADKVINLSFALIEALFLISVFKVTIVFPKNIGLFLVIFVLGTLIAYFINLTLSFVGFWTPEVWAPRFVFFMTISFLSGTYFPLDLLPSIIYRLLLLTPFPYLFYLPTRLLINKIPPDINLLILGSFVWVFLGYFITKAVWKKGNREFSFWGR